MRVLVCGGRNYGEVPVGFRQMQPSQEYNRALRRAEDERTYLFQMLNELSPRPTVIIHGAASGADSWAKRWAEVSRIPHEPYKADWYPNGSKVLDYSAGPRRNQQMIDEGKPELVVAFPGGKGTADMVSRARAANITVREIR